jgi:hypothetical protein
MGFGMISSILRQKRKISLVLATGKKGDGRNGGAPPENECGVLAPCCACLDNSHTDVL